MPNIEEADMAALTLDVKKLRFISNDANPYQLITYFFTAEALLFLCLLCFVRKQGEPRAAAGPKEMHEDHTNTIDT